MYDADVASLVLRLAVGVTIFLHGWNHMFGGGKLAGTASWFESMGLRPGIVHATMATATELGAGVFLILGLLTPLAAGAVTGTMVVAIMTAHRKNGFFIFKPGQGYEYCLFIVLTCYALASLGGGRWSLDNALDLDLSGGVGLGAAVAIGLGGSALLLATSWRPAQP